MPSQAFCRVVPPCLLALFACAAVLAQDAIPGPAKPASAPASLHAGMVEVPVVVFDREDPVTTLAQSDFALSVEGKPQTIQSVVRESEMPVTVGLLADVSRSQTGILAEEQKAAQQFLDGLLKPAGPQRPADKAFVLQFAHSAELLQDVTDAHSLLASGLKEIGTEAPGAADEETPQTSNTPLPAPDSRGTPGGYGRRGGYPGQGGNTGGTQPREDRAHSGTVLYDALYLAATDVMSRQRERHVLVVVSDGIDRHSKESLKEALEAAQRSNTTIYAVYYKGRDTKDYSGNRGYDGYPGYGGGYPGYGGGYPGYGRPGYPGSGGSPGSDGTYADPDGKKILERFCSETGGRLFDSKGKGGLSEIFAQIGKELRSGYLLSFTPTPEVAGAGFHPLQLTLTQATGRKFELQTKDGYYGRDAASRN